MTVAYYQSRTIDHAMADRVCAAVPQLFF